MDLPYRTCQESTTKDFVNSPITTRVLNLHVRSAKQRMGRAGRMMEGVCIRLFSKNQIAEHIAFRSGELNDLSVEEQIQRSAVFSISADDIFDVHPRETWRHVQLLELGDWLSRLHFVRA